jgi:hypothetical protein
MADAIKVHLYDVDTLLCSPTVSGTTWSKSGQTLGAGLHQLKAKSEDLAGNIGAFSTITYIFSGSTTKPICDLLDDSGQSSTDNVTNDSTPRIKVILVLSDEYTSMNESSPIPLAAVKALKLQKSTDGGSTWTDVDTHTVVSGDYTTPCTFSYTYQFATALSDGTVKFRAMWQDSMNTWSAPGNVISVVIDTVAPNAPAITAPVSGMVFIGTSINISGTAS